ncbi:MAG: LamG-like jellyroll fold domain-containing protein [Candidatus Peribacteraceae bacterium]
MRKTLPSIALAKEGFTLIELLLVVGIIGALAGIVMEAIGPRKMLLSAKDASRKQTVRELQNALTQYQIEEGTLPNVDDIITADDGAKPICKQGVTTDATCVNVDALIPEYIAALPQDTSETNANYTGYKVYREPLGGRPLVTSPHFNDRSEGLVGYWPFHEGQGTTAVDGSGQGNNGTLNGTTGANNRPQWTTGQVGMALDFDGTDDYVNVPDTNVLDIAGDLTVCAWLYPRTMTVSAHPLQKYGGSTAANFRLYRTAAGSTYFYATRGGVWGSISSSYTVAASTWSHICLSYEATRGGQLYVNGIARGSRAGGGALTTTSSALRIGGNTYYNGLIDEVRIYNRALSAEEVAALAQGRENVM